MADAAQQALRQKDVEIQHLQQQQHDMAVTVTQHTQALERRLNDLAQEATARLSQQQHQKDTEILHLHHTMQHTTEALSSKLQHAEAHSNLVSENVLRTRTEPRGPGQ